MGNNAPQPNKNQHQNMYLKCFGNKNNLSNVVALAGIHSSLSMHINSEISWSDTHRIHAMKGHIGKNKNYRSHTERIIIKYFQIYENKPKISTYSTKGKIEWLNTRRRILPKRHCRFGVLLDNNIGGCCCCC